MFIKHVIDYIIISKISIRNIKMTEFSKIKSEILLDKGNLYIVSTPIGNLGDITLRALETLDKIDCIICENIMITKKLLNKYNLKHKKMISYNDFNASQKRNGIIKNLLNKTFHFALVSDAGTPLISDPGFKLVEECIKKKIKVTHIPGPSAVISGLILSGLSTDKFLFGGFLEKTSQKKEKQLFKFINLDVTTIWFESGNRLLKTLDTINKLMNNRRIAVLRELTKIHEEILFGTTEEIIELINLRLKLKGEFIIVISGFKSKKTDIKVLKKLILEDINKVNTKELSNKLSDKTRLPKNFIYNEIIKLKKNT